MEILNGVHITKTFGVRTILQDVSFSVNETDKIGIMGVNGAGKTTLFKIILGEEDPTQGAVVKQKNSKIGYMPQQVSYFSKKTALEDALESFSHLQGAEAQLNRLQSEMETDHSAAVIRQFTELNERFIAEGGLTYRNRTRSMLLGLGLLEEEILLPLSELSGGQRTRVLLAKLLLAEPDLLLLDEPTNHLDLDAVEWLENYLLGYRGAVLAVSHDRYFIDMFANRIFELENNTLKSYKGNYSDFVRLKAEALLAQQREYEKQKRELTRIEGIIAQQKQWNTERSLVTARSKEKMADRIRREIVKPDEEPASIRFSIKAKERSGNDVLCVEHLEKSFDGHLLFKNVCLDIKRKERVFLLGKNGIGKTTLFRILLGELAADRGEVQFGANVSCGYYAQTQENLPNDKSILEAVYEQVKEQKLGNIRNVLAAFLFTGEDIDKKIATLSGGERARVALAILMLSEHNLLLLDEPTNHLDIPSREILEDALLQYDGTLLAISHDRYFVQKISTKIYALDTQGAVLFDGGYASYVQARAADTQNQSSPKQESRSAEEYKKRRRDASAKRKLVHRAKQLEGQIVQTEEKIRFLNKKLFLPEVACDYEEALRISNEVKDLEQKLPGLYEEWEKINPLE